MGREVKIQKTVYDKGNYGKVVDRSFSSFKQEEEIPVFKSVDDFFKDYEDLYLEMAIEGDEKSHRYLYERSGELLDIQNAETDIQPLLDEIAELRQQLLEANNKILEQQLEIANLIASNTGE
jgi:hypothetical protein